LFETNRDGHVVAALAEEYERLGKIENTRRWFTEASHLIRNPSTKRACRMRCAALGRRYSPAGHLKNRVPKV
jgi:hypothetical protein